MGADIQIWPVELLKLTPIDRQYREMLFEAGPHGSLTWMRAGDCVHPALGEEAVLGGVDRFRVGRHRRLRVARTPAVCPDFLARTRFECVPLQDAR